MRGGRRLYLLLLSLMLVVRGDLFHYFHLKKFLTAVAFARALGRRPTILPVPIPIPIPIGQNEVIRLPAKSAKTFLTLTGSPKYSGGGGGGGGFGKEFTGSSSFGYALPGSYDSGLGGGEPNIVVLNGNGYGLDALGGGADFASSNLIHMVSGRPRGFSRHRPPRVIFAGGGRTPRTSENMAWPVREIPPVIHYVPRQTKSSKKSKKPIPVGEKFRLP